MEKLPTNNSTDSKPSAKSNGVNHEEDKNGVNNEEEKNNKPKNTYNLENDGELWMKLQFIECLRDKDFEEAQEYLEELLELYPSGNTFLKEFKQLLPEEIRQQKVEEEMEEEEEEDEDEEEFNSESEEGEEDEEEDDDKPEPPPSSYKDKAPKFNKWRNEYDDKGPKRKSMFFVPSK